MKIIVRLIYKLFEFIPWAGTPMKVINYELKIKRLERNGNFDEARKVRAEALSSIPPSHQGPLLRSEGEDLLYRQKNYEGALQIFEKAITAMQQSPALYGVSSPDHIYGGAAQAALLCNEIEKASKYYLEFSGMVENYSNDPKLENNLEWHRKTLNFLESHPQVARMANKQT